MKIHSVLNRSSRFQLVTVCGLLVLASGCASRNTMSGGKETTVLGGAFTRTTDSFQPIPPATINTDTSMLVGSDGPSGTKVTLFWGLLTFHDY